jgi:hypothetical protein
MTDLPNQEYFLQTLNQIVGFGTYTLPLVVLYELLLDILLLYQVLRGPDALPSLSVESMSYEPTGTDLPSELFKRRLSKTKNNKSLRTLLNHTATRSRQHVKPKGSVYFFFAKI